MEIAVTDIGGEQSNIIYANIMIMNRNDGPDLDLGPGMINFTENGQSVAVVTSYLLDLMDEEGHRILNMSVELIATVGSLDTDNATTPMVEGDTIFLQGSFLPPLSDFFFNPSTVITPTYIYVEFNSTPEGYIGVLDTLRYTNTLLEPTLFENGQRIQREIIISLSDVNLEQTVVRVGVNIIPINDNAPVIFIDSDPKCTEDYRDSGEVITRSRRNVKLVSKRSRKRMLSNFREFNSLWVSLRTVKDDVIDYNKVNR